MLTSNKINHKNCLEYIWDEEEKMLKMRSFVANM